MSASKGCVLIVEDEYLISMLTEESLDALGYNVGANVATLEEGLKVAAVGSFEVAVLDVNLRGKLSFPIADVLSQRGIPFLFTTGYGREALAPRFANSILLQKPYTIDALEQKLSLTRAAKSDI